MANIPITDNTTLLQSLKDKANNLPNKGSSGGTDVSGVTATAGDVLSGKVIVNSSGQEVTGTMPNNGAVSQTVTANGDVSIAEGYHNGSGKITVNVEGGASMPTDGDAASGDVLSGKTFYSGGSKKTGTMKTVLFTNTIDVDKTTGNITATASSTGEGYVSSTSSVATKQLDLYNFQTTITPSNTDTTINTSGCFLTDNIVVTGDSNLVAGNIKKDVSIFGITGTLAADSCKTGVITAYGDGGTYQDIISSTANDTTIHKIYLRDLTDVNTPKQIYIISNTAACDGDEALICATFDIENDFSQTITRSASFITSSEGTCNPLGDSALMVDTTDGYYIYTKLRMFDFCKTYKYVVIE